MTLFITVFNPLTKAAFHLHCGLDGIVANWHTKVFRSNSPLNVSLLDPSCNEYTQNSTHTTIASNFTECGWYVTQNEKTIVYDNTATVISTFQNNIIRKRKTYQYPMSCTYDRTNKIMTVNRYEILYSGVKSGEELGT